MALRLLVDYGLLHDLTRAVTILLRTYAPDGRLQSWKLVVTTMQSARYKERYVCSLPPNKKNRVG